MNTVELPPQFLEENSEVSDSPHEIASDFALGLCIYWANAHTEKPDDWTAIRIGINTPWGAVTQTYIVEFESEEEITNRFIQYVELLSKGAEGFGCSLNHLSQRLVEVPISGLVELMRKTSMAEVMVNDHNAALYQHYDDGELGAAVRHARFLAEYGATGDDANNAGFVLMSAGELQEAFELFNVARSTTPDPFIARFNLAILNLKNNQLKEFEEGMASIVEDMSARQLSKDCYVLVSIIWNEETQLIEFLNVNQPRLPDEAQFCLDQFRVASEASVLESANPEATG